MEQARKKIQNIISSDSNYRLFCDLPILKGIRSRDRMHLFSCFETMDFAQGEEVYCAGTASEQRIYLILQGNVNVTAGIDTYTTLHAGDVFGLFSFLDDKRTHTGTVMAETALSTLTIDKHYFNEITLKEPALGHQMLRFLFSLLSRMALKLESEYVAMHSLFSGGQR